MGDEPRQETFRLDGEWSKVVQDDLDDDDYNDDEADLAVVRDGGDREQEKSSDRVFISRLLVCKLPKKEGGITTKYRLTQTLFILGS